MGLSESMQEDDFNEDDEEEDVRVFLTSRLIIHSRGVQLPDFVAASLSRVRALENHSGFGFVSSELRRTPR